MRLLLKYFETDTEYRLSAIGRTYASYEWFFKVRDYYAAYVDKETLLPRISIRDVHEGGYRLYDKVTFDQESKKAVSLRGKTKEVAQPTSYALKSCMHDVLSIIYYTRNIDFENYAGGTDFPLAIFMDQGSMAFEVDLPRYRAKCKSTRTGPIQHHQIQAAGNFGAGVQ